MQHVVVFGTGPLARLLRHLIETTTGDKVVAFTVDAAYKTCEQFEGKPVYAYHELEQSLVTDDIKLLCAIGYSNMRLRQQLFLRLKADGWRFYSYISPAAVVDSSAVLGDNSVIMANAVVEPFCVLGDNNLLWSSSTLCHDSIVGNHNFVAAGTTIGGCCRIGDLCFFGFNAVVSQQLHIADESLIGASALVLHDTAFAGKYLGSPARVVSTHQDTGIRL